MDNKIRTAIEVAIGIVAVSAIGFSVYASSSVQEQREIDNLKQQLADSIQREQTAKYDYDNCKLVMEQSHKTAEAERELQFSLNEQLMKKVGLIESR